MAQMDNDGKLYQNKIRAHVQVKKRATVNISIENKRIIISGSKCIIDKIKARGAANINLEKLCEEVFICSDNCSEDTFKYEKYVFSDHSYLPKLPCKFLGDHWNLNVAQNVIMEILNCLGFGHGGTHKYKSQDGYKPPGWPLTVAFDFKHPWELKYDGLNEAIQSLLEFRGLDPFQHHHSDSVVQPKAKRPRKTKAVSNATLEEPTDNAHEEDNAGGVHQEDPADDAHEEEHAGGDHPASDQEDGHDHVDEEFNHGLTLDQSEKYYWSFSVQQWFPLAMNENGDFYWNYPEQTWSRFK